MAAPNSPEERKRRNRNIVFSAFGILLVLWTIKLSLPRRSVVDFYNGSTEIASSPPASVHQGYGVISLPGSKTSPTSSVVKHYKPTPTPSNPQQIAGNVISATDTVNITEKAAVIIETRYRTNLIPLILHFSTVLGPSWPILIYTSAESVGLFSSSAALSRYLRSGLIQLRILPSTVLFVNSNSVSEFMTNTWLWDSLAPAEHILVFQSDSMLCANAARSVEDFFAYDFVGAPIRDDLGNGYNGGLSLRKRNSTMRVLEKWDWETTQKSGDRFEDQWFYNRLLSLQEREAAQGIEPEEEGAINLPSMEVARTFSVETIDFPHPLGVHQVHRWIKQGILSLDQWCPEYKLCSVDHIKDN